MMASGAYSEYLCWNIKTVRTIPILAWTFEAKSQKGMSDLYRMWGSHIGVMKSSIFRDLTLCSPLKINWRFRGRCCLHLQGQRMSQARALLAACCHAGFLLGLFFDPDDGGDMFLGNVCWLSVEYTTLYPRTQNSLWATWSPACLTQFIGMQVIKKMV
jgi:hypothetical protein